jgi:segregation and condensation protein B
MDLKTVDKLIEGILFVSGNGVAAADLCEKLELQRSELDDALEKLQKKYNAASGIHILSFNGKIQMCSNPLYADAIARVLNPIREKELSRSALEVAAIVAYKQPVTRLDIEQVRGVNSDYALQMLIKHDLVQVAGRKDAVGKPLLFCTTDTFLKRFQLQSLSELPDYDALIERIKVIDDGIKEESSLFDFPEDEPPPDFSEKGE